MEATLFSDPQDADKDLRLLERALNGRWKMDERWFEHFPPMVAKLAISAQKETTRLQAVRVLQKMLDQNRQIDHERKPKAKLHIHATVDQCRTELDRIAERVRERAMVIDAPDRGAAGGEAAA